MKGVKHTLDSTKDWRKEFEGRALE